MNRRRQNQIAIESLEHRNSTSAALLSLAVGAIDFDSPGVEVAPVTSAADGASIGLATSRALNPQPLPPDKSPRLNPQPLPPDKSPWLNPQPLPPDKRPMLNPQPLPPQQSNSVGLGGASSLSGLAASRLAMSAEGSAISRALNPQPLPPDKGMTLNPQPLAPQEASQGTAGDMALMSGHITASRAPIGGGTRANLPDFQLAGVTFDSATRTISIQGSNGADTAEVRESGSDIEVTLNGAVTRVARQGASAASCDPQATRCLSIQRVSRIEFRGLGGNDRFHNFTNIPAVAHGDGGDDMLSGGTGTDQLYGGDDNDHLFGGGTDDRRDSDFLDGGGGNDHIFGDAGDDTLLGQQGDDTIYGGTGNDIIRGFAGVDHVYAEIGNDLVEGGDDPDRIHGGDGHDSLSGQQGDDLIIGSIGDDDIWGDDGADTLYGGGGHDFVDGGNHGDEITGDDGNDELYGGVGDDLVDGGSDYDTARSVDPDRLAAIESVGIEVDSLQPQNDTTSCGPNAASRLLRFYGHDSSYAVARALMRFNPNMVTYLNLGTPPSVLLEIMRVWRPETRVESLGSFDRVLELLGSGKPVVALVGFGSVSVNFGLFESGTTPRMLHYVTLTGFDRASQRLFYTDTDGARKAWSFAHFNRLWNFSASGAAGDFLTGTLGVKQRTILY